MRRFLGLLLLVAFGKSGKSLTYGVLASFNPFVFVASAMVLDMAVKKQHLTDEGSELQGMLAESEHVMEPLMPAIIEERAKCCFQVPKCTDVKC